MASMLASQSAGYAVPAGAGDVAFTTSAAMGAVVWSQLTESQLAEWHQIWTATLTNPGRMTHCFKDSTGATVDLFEVSPLDGFCVAFALRAAAELKDPWITGFLRQLERPL